MSPPNAERGPCRGPHSDQLAATLTDKSNGSCRHRQEPGANTPAEAHAEALRLGALILQPRTDSEARQAAELGRHGFAGLRHLAGTHDLIAAHITDQEQSR